MTTMAEERVELGRVWWVGLLAVAAAWIVNAVVIALARALFSVPAGFTPFTVPQFTVLTVGGVGGAAVVFGLLARFAQRPIRTFRILAVVALLLSFLPDIGLLLAGDQLPFPGASARSVGTLMLLHVIDAAISVGLLTTLTRAK